ncbi:hypothetical protein HYR53_10385 [Candidatus Acetothermia bacterium]|nr:hypothetical protein [Candidatus Acetothermia bacterium]
MNSGMVTTIELVQNLSACMTSANSIMNRVASSPNDPLKKLDDALEHFNKARENYLRSNEQMADLISRKSPENYDPADAVRISKILLPLVDETVETLNRGRELKKAIGLYLPKTKNANMKSRFALIFRAMTLIDKEVSKFLTMLLDFLEDMSFVPELRRRLNNLDNEKADAKPWREVLINSK